MKKVMIALFAMTLSVIAYAQSNDEKTLLKLNHEFIQNFINNDTVAHNKIIHPKNFILIGGSGELVNRRDYMIGWSHGYDKAVMPEFDYRDVEVRMFGNAAIVIAKTHYVTKKDGQWMIGETRYADTYIKENDRWWCVQAHLTRMPMKPRE